MKTPVQLDRDRRYANPIDIEDAHLLRDFMRGLRRVIQGGICFGLFVWLGFLVAQWVGA